MIGYRPASSATSLPVEDEGSGAALDSLGGQLEEYGLSGPAARVLLALLQCGRATAGQLARASAVNRTSTYQILEVLRARGLAEQLSGKFAVWSSPGADAVMDRLLSGQEERLQHLRSVTEDVRRRIARIAPSESSVTLSPIQLIANAAQVRRAFTRLVTKARSEILIFHLPPYAFRSGKVNQEGIEAAKRGVSCRALYQAADLAAPESARFRQEHEAYIAVGLQVRLVEKLPVKLAIFDQESALLTTRARTIGDYPTTLLITDEGFAGALVAAFERLWDGGRPYAPRSMSVARPAAAHKVRRGKNQ